MGRLWTYFISLVPARYRSRSSFDGSEQLLRAGVLSGMLQVIVFSMLFIGAFITKATGLWEQASQTVLSSEKGETMNPIQVRLATGTLGVVGFALQPLHLFYAWMIVEGGVRAFSAFAFSHVLPTFPFWLIAVVHNAVEKPSRKKQAVFLSRDVIQPARDATYDLHVLSPVPKEWSPFIGIRFQGELYLLDGEEHEVGPREFGYRLRKNPPGNLVVVTCNYSPNLDNERSSKDIHESVH